MLRYRKVTALTDNHLTANCQLNLCASWKPRGRACTKLSPFPDPPPSPHFPPKAPKDATTRMMPSRVRIPSALEPSKGARVRECTLSAACLFSPRRLATKHPDQRRNFPISLSTTPRKRLIASKVTSSSVAVLMLTSSVTTVTCSYTSCVDGALTSLKTSLDPL